MWDVVGKTYAKEGVLGFYRGLLPTLAKVVPAVSISYVVYEHAKRRYALIPSYPRNPTNHFVSFAALASETSWERKEPLEACHRDLASSSRLFYPVSSLPVDLYRVMYFFPITYDLDVVVQGVWLSKGSVRTRF
jgi:Mitochondrial carrier protein